MLETLEMEIPHLFSNLLPRTSKRGSDGILLEEINAVLNPMKLVKQTQARKKVLCVGDGPPRSTLMGRRGENRLSPLPTLNMYSLHFTFYKLSRLVRAGPLLSTCARGG
jgi:hypothetical protein